MNHEVLNSLQKAPLMCPQLLDTGRFLSPKLYRREDLIPSILDKVLNHSGIGGNTAASPSYTLHHKHRSIRLHPRDVRT